MSNQPLWLRDLVAYSFQAGILVGVGAILASLMRPRVPRVRLAYWQALLAACVFLPLLQPWRPEIMESPGVVTTGISFATPAATPNGPSLAEIVLFLICAGIILRALWLSLGLLRLWLYRRQAQRIERPPEAVKDAQRLVRVFPALFISRQLPTPATFGFLRPAILFPAHFLEMEPAMQKAIALHELLHVERRDWLWNMFEELVLTLLWFHIPLWWVVRRARLSREQVVDGEAVRRGRERRAYLKALLVMAGQRPLAESLPAPLFLREGQLAERITLMMKEARMSRKQLTVFILSAVSVLLIAGATLVWAFPLKTPAPSAEPSEESSFAPAAQSGPAVATPPSGGIAEAQAGTDQSGPNAKKSSGIKERPVPIYKQQPRYTPEAKQKHVEGTVVLSCMVDAKGNVTEVSEISKPLGEGLDESAINAVRNWKFKPATLNGAPVPVKTAITINFKLEDKFEKASPKSNSAIEPSDHAEQTKAETATGGQFVKIDLAEIQRQVDQALKQAKIAQKAASNIDQAKIQKQVDEAMKRLTRMQIAAPRLDEAKLKRQIEQAMQQAKIAQKATAGVDQAEIQRQMQETMKQLEKMNTPEMRKQIEQAMKQARMEQLRDSRIDSAEIQRQIKQALKQAEIARLAAERAQREAEKARQDFEKQRNELKPPAPHQPSPAPPVVLPTPPSPPQAPLSDGVAKGAPGGVAGSVPSAPVAPMVPSVPPASVSPAPAVPAPPQN